MSRPAPSLYVQKLQPVPKDIIAVRARYSAAESVSDKGGIHPYLNEQRALPASLIASDRFAGRVAIDYRGCALWPHWNEDGLCGYEIRGPEFKGFAAGAYKGLWGSRISEQDHELVIAESALNAMSYAALHGFACTRFVSTAGTMNEHQPGLVRLAIEKLPIGGTVIAAVDHDVAGQTIAEQLRAVFEQIGRKDLRFRIDCPPNAGGDWNDVLKSASHIAGLNNPEPA
jgi:hypothetical protein